MKPRTTKISVAKKTSKARSSAASADTAPLGGFAGFGDLKFFDRLAKEQSRDWFLAHKSEYERDFAEPMAALLGELQTKLEKAYPKHELAPPKVFRIQRDVRFSKDKSPYKTHAAGVVTLKGAGSADAPPASALGETPAVVYVHLGLDEGKRSVMAGAGIYMMMGAALESFREALLDDEQGAELASLVRKLGKAGFTFESGETLKNAPRGVAPDHPRVELLKRKGLVAMYPGLDEKLIRSRELVEVLVARSIEVAPLVRWLASLE
ncbi:MAG: DUF2461 domain-containing protein [Polyangiaceae bacterium]